MNDLSVKLTNTGVICSLEDSVVVNKAEKNNKKKLCNPAMFTIKANEHIIEFKNFSLYSDNQKEKLLSNISIKIQKNCTTCIIGRSGSGKSCLIRSLNRINEEISNKFTFTGDILFHNVSIYHKKTRIHKLRKDIGMVFQKPLPFNMSIYNNILFSLRVNGVYNKKIQNQIIIKALKDVGLYDEVKHKLFENALKLSGGQQQRLCIARAICINPEVILFDEPTSALDPIATQQIEKLINELTKKYTIILVTHSLKQAIRVSKYTIYMENSKIIEYNFTNKLMNRPKFSKTIKFIENEE